MIDEEEEGEQGDMFERPVPVHRSLDYHRVEHDKEHRPLSLELAFAEVWEEENKPQAYLNQGHGILQNLMFQRNPNGFGERARLVITPRDAAVAATAVQWLGTNCGGGFLDQVFKRAGWRLLGPGEVQHEEHLRRREQRINKYRAEIVAKETLIANQVQGLRVRADELAVRVEMLEQRRRDLAAEQANFLALIMAANIGQVRYTEQPLVRRARRIVLDG